MHARKLTVLAPSCEVRSLVGTDRRVVRKIFFGAPGGRALPCH